MLILYLIGFVLAFLLLRWGIRKMYLTEEEIKTEVESKERDQFVKDHEHEMERETAEWIWDKYH